MRSPPITRPAVVVVAALVAVVAAMSWVASSPRRRMQPPSMSEVALTAAKPIAPPVVGHPRSHAEGTAGPSSRAGAPSARLQAELKSATDWRAFALAAANRPTEGGYFYAMRVLDLCRRPISASADFANSNVAAVVRVRGTVSSEQLDVARRFSGVCASFAAHEADALLESIKDKANDGTDPLVDADRAMQRASYAHDPSALSDALRMAMESRDPLLLSSETLLPRTMLVGGDKPSAPVGLWFDGDSYSMVGAASNNLLSAVALATCRDDSVCDLDDKMAVDCLRGGDCSQDHRTWIRNQYLAAGYTQEQFDSVVAPLAERVRARIEAADTRAFVRR